MEIKDKIKYSLIAIAIILGFVLIFTFIRNIRYTKDDLYKSLVAQKDSTIVAIKSERATLLLFIKADDEHIREHEINDSLAAIQYQKGQQVHNQLNDKIKNIPGHIADIGNNNDSLYLILSAY